MSQPEDYARATGAPRAVTLGGLPYFVGKLRPVDFGLIQAFYKDSLPNPLEDARDQLRAEPDMDDELARAIWVDAVEEASDWPPEVSSELGTMLLDSMEGRARFLWVVLRRFHPATTIDDAKKAAARVTQEEVNRLIERVMPGDLGDLVVPADGEKPITYTEMRAQLCERFHGWTFETVDHMDFDQIADACRMGRPLAGPSARTVAEAQRIAERWREFYRGL